MGDWHPGDLSSSGIGLTLCYTVLAAACFGLARGHSQRDRRRGWILVAALFAGIAAERQMGLLDLFTGMMRAQARADGSYAARPRLQEAALAGLGIVSVVMLAIVFTLTRRAGGFAVGLATIAVSIAFYLAAKAVSLHAVDRVLFYRVAGVAMGNVVEAALAATGLLAAALAALAYRNRSRARVRPASAPRGSSSR